MPIFSKVTYYRGSPVIGALSIAVLDRLPGFVLAVPVELMPLLAGLEFLHRG